MYISIANELCVKLMKLKNSQKGKESERKKKFKNKKEIKKSYLKSKCGEE